MVVRTGTGFIDVPAFCKTVHGEASVKVMRFVVGNRVRKAPTRSGGGFKASVAPSAIEIQTLYRSRRNDGAAIGRHVHDAAPVAQYA